MVGTDALIESAQLAGERARLVAILQRDEVRAQLIELGVDPQVAEQRVSRLTQQELEQLTKRLNETPAGGISVLGVILVVFVVFIITDVLGATDIFPFVRPVRR